jgi:peptidoglycan-associated lipoprotein
VLGRVSTLVERAGLGYNSKRRRLARGVGPGSAGAKDWGKMMRTKFLALIGVLLLVGACESTPSDTGNTSGTTGAQTGQGGGVGSGQVGVARPGSAEDFQQNVGDRVYFATDKSDLSAEARATLQKQAVWLRRYPNVTITVEGHCDERGTREYNLALGERRANAAREYLRALGVEPTRMKTISYGKERPVALGSNEDAWKQNRRAVTVVSGGPSVAAN